MTAYSKREHAFLAGETLYRAEPDALTAGRPDGARLAIPWSGVTHARLAFAPTRLKPDRRLFRVASPAGLLAIDNMHYEGPGRFARRDEAFAALVAESAARIAAAAPAARLYLGVSVLSYIGLFLLALCGLGLAAVAILSFSGRIGGWPLAAVLHLLVLGFGVPMLVRWAVRARPRRTDAAGMTQSALSGAKT